MKQEIKKNADVYCKTYAVNMWERKRRNKQWENRGDIRLAKVSTGLEIIIKNDDENVDLWTNIETFVCAFLDYE